MRIGWRAAAATAAVLVLTGCGSTGGGDTESQGRTQVPQLNSTKQLADPKSWTGEVDVDLASPDIRPVEQNPTPKLPVTVTDARNKKVTVTDASRILALDIYGTLSQTVFELGLGENIVGRDVSSNYPQINDRPLVTHDGHQLSAEAILQLDPTVVVTDTSLGPYDVLLQLQDAGIPVVTVDSERSLANLASLTGQVADALGVPAAGEKLGKRIVAETAAVRKQIAAVAPKQLNRQLRTVFLYVRGQANVYYMFGEGTGAAALIGAVGGYDVTKEIGWSGMKPVNDEGLIAAQPDAIFMMSLGLKSVGGVDGLMKHFPALANTPAGQHRRIIAMPDSQILSFGPRTPAVLNALAVAMYAPDAL